MKDLNQQILVKPFIKTAINKYTNKMHFVELVHLQQKQISSKAFLVAYWKDWLGQLIREDSLTSRIML